MEFMLGCNYLDSSRGSAMWEHFDENSIDKDLAVLSRYGIKYLRVFPNWRDFQPAIKMYGQNALLYEYRMKDESLPTNEYYIDEKMIERFIKFCEIADKYDMKLIVGLLTGWLSSRLFIPDVLNDKNLFSDPEALIFEQKYVSGFVKYTKHIKNIFAWDLGNECNNLSMAQSRDEAFCWANIISNAIRAQDSTRPVVSGMHGLEPQGIWRISDQAQTTDILTTHPYPLWVEHCSNDKIASVRTLMHATAQTVYYSSVGEKPCLVEETGTMGPMVCSDEVAAGFIKTNLFSNWANGSMGVLWWCSSDQNTFTHAPYDWAMCEREIGLTDNKRNPKPALLAMGEFKGFLDNLDITLPKAETDAVCILTRDQDQWGIAYTTYILAKQAGLNIKFAYADKNVPEAKAYLLPSVKGHLVMNKSIYDDLKDKVKNGANLYISMSDGFLTEFSELTGLKIIDSQLDDSDVKAILNGKELSIKRNKKYTVKAVSANVICSEEAQPLISENKFGKGNVFYLNAPLEESLIKALNGFDNNLHEIYRTVFKGILDKKPFVCKSDRVGVTFHYKDNSVYAVIVNYSDKVLDPQITLQNGYSVKRVIYGDISRIAQYSACVLELER